MGFPPPPPPPPTPQEVASALAEGAGQMMGAVGEIAKTVAGMGQDAADNLASNITSVMEASTAPLTAILDKLKDLVTSAPPPRPPVDPVQVLASISQAIHNAESNLNKNRLAISQGTIEIDLTVGIPGAGQAAAKISMTIGPTPIA